MDKILTKIKAADSERKKSVAATELASQPPSEPVRRGSNIVNIFYVF